MTTITLQPVHLATQVVRRVPAVWWITILMAIAWHHTFVELWCRWFPAWNHTHLSWMDRLTQGDSYYAHGPLACIASAAIAVLVARRTEASSQRTGKASAVGVVLLIAALTVHLLSLWLQINFTSACALIGTIAGLLLVAGGWPMARAYSAPTLLLFFMVPLPMTWIVQLNFDLKMAMASWAAAWAQTVAHLTTTIQGNAVLIRVPEAPIQTLWIDDGCSGLRSLIALSWFAALFAVVCQLRTVWRWVIFAMAVPLALLINMVRITLLIVLAYHLGVEAVADDAAAHQWISLGMFAIALLIFIAFEQTVLKLGALLGQRWSAMDHPRRFKSTRHNDRPRLDRWVWVIVTATALVAIGIGVRSTPPRALAWEPAIIDKAVWLDGRVFHGQDLAISERFQDALGTEHVLHRRYTNRSGTTLADLLLVYDGIGRRSIHPPQVCLEANGSEILSQQDVSVELPGGRLVVMRELIAQHGPLRVCHLYVYRHDNRYTVSFLRQQIARVWTGLEGNHTGMALVRLSMVDTEASLPQVRRQAMSLAQQLLPQIERLTDKPSRPTRQPSWTANRVDLIAAQASLSP